MPWTCPVCQIDVADAVEKCECGALRPRDERPRAKTFHDPTVADHRQTVPIAVRCPGCGSDKYRKVNPKAVVAFTKDRVCLNCQTRYAPPTPPWGSITFIVAGGLLALGMGFAAFVRLALAGSNPCGVIGLVIEVALAIMGMMAFVHGIRTLFEKPVDIPPLPREPEAPHPG
jgi:hypothetical protein